MHMTLMICTCTYKLPPFASTGLSSWLSTTMSWNGGCLKYLYGSSNTAVSLSTSKTLYPSRSDLHGIGQVEQGGCQVTVVALSCNTSTVGAAFCKPCKCTVSKAPQVIDVLQIRGFFKRAPGAPNIRNDTVYGGAHSFSVTQQ